MKGLELGLQQRRRTDVTDAKVYQIPQSNPGFIHSLGDEKVTARRFQSCVNVNVLLLAPAEREHLC